MNLKIGDRVYVHGHVDEIRKDIVIIRNEGGYFGTVPSEIVNGEFTHCKDCKNAEERGCALFCGFWTRYTAHKGYCFKAEKREE